MTHSLHSVKFARGVRHATSPIVLAALGAGVAISALGGAWGLMSGSIDLGTKVTGRLPFESPGFAGLALAVIVGLPALALTWLAARRDERADLSAVAAGGALIGWIVVELAFIRETSWLQALFAAVGLVLIVLGQRDRSPR